MLGNHDSWEDDHDEREELRGADITLLESEAVRGTTPSLVAHNPDSLSPALNHESPWALALAGHTHGGQFRGAYDMLPHRPMSAGGRYLTGWTHEAGTEVLVSNGVGLVTLPFRLFSPAQVHVITLRRGDGAGAAWAAR